MTPDRPPVSGEPRTERAPGLGVTFATGMMRAFSDDDVLALLRRVEAEAVRRNLAPASTGAALDVLRDLFVAMQAEPVVHGTDRFHHDRWMRWSRDTFMPAWNAAAECIARLAEQEGEGR